MDDGDAKKAEPVCQAPPLPPEIGFAELLQGWSQCKGEELVFMQLPDSLPGQPPTQDQRPIKTEVKTEDGQSVLVKQEMSQVTLFFTQMKRIFKHSNIYDQPNQFGRVGYRLALMHNII